MKKMILVMTLLAMAALSGCVVSGPITGIEYEVKPKKAVVFEGPLTGTTYEVDVNVQD